MPIYVYEHVKQKRCKTFEHYQSINDSALVDCPCCKKPVKRAITKFIPLVSGKRAFKKRARHKDGDPFSYHVGGKKHDLGTDRKDAAKKLQDICNAHYPRGMATVETE